MSKAVVPLKVTNPDELIAAIPHLLGFQVEVAVAVVAVTPGLPHARTDLPERVDQQREMVAAILDVYRRYLDAAVLLVAFSADRARADAASARLAEALRDAGLGVRERLWAGADTWVQLGTGRSGQRSPSRQSVIDAEVVHRGQPMPRSSRAALQQTLHGGPEINVRLGG